MSTHVPGFQSFPGFLHYFVMAKLATSSRGLSHDLETWCLKLVIVKILGVQIFKGDHNILIFQP